jgi:hypothetical protein
MFWFREMIPREIEHHKFLSNGILPSLRGRMSTLIFYAAKSYECAQIFDFNENLCSVYEAGLSEMSRNF